LLVLCDNFQYFLLRIRKQAGYKPTRVHSKFAKIYNPGVLGGSQIKTQVSLCVDYLVRILSPEDFQQLHSIDFISWMNKKDGIGKVGRFLVHYTELPSGGKINKEGVLSWDVAHRALLDAALKTRREALTADSRSLPNKQGEIIYKKNDILITDSLYFVIKSRGREQQWE